MKTTKLRKTIDELLGELLENPDNEKAKAAIAYLSLAKASLTTPKIPKHPTSKRKVATELKAQIVVGLEVMEPEELAEILFGMVAIANRAIETEEEATAA